MSPSELQLLSFITMGGPVMPILVLIAFAIWVIVIERLYALKFSIRRDHKQYIDHGLFNPKSNIQPKDYYWAQTQISASAQSQFKQALNRGLALLKVLVACCPLLGLLGTVIGMISVFDTIAITGNSDAGRMAAGIYQATLPTMTGLAIALFALLINHYLIQLRNKNLAIFEQQLQQQLGKHKKLSLGETYHER